MKAALQQQQLETCVECVQGLLKKPSDFTK